ncbi:MAG: N-acetylmuramoyl-L-alanine amidase [Paludibacteraceae bacterium]|nr:N-acetylmuramoyl-L-alanine amidase [Paludibacteraceae bacterium]
MKNSSFYFMRFLLFLVLSVSVSLGYSAESSPFVVVLDAGHGGKDVGAIGYSLKLREKNVNLQTVLKLGKLLEKEENVKVIYTRKKDVFIPLDERAQIANRAKADLFISIHTNSAQSRSAKGTETYTVGSSSANIEVAKRENSVMLYEEDYQTRYQGFDPNSTESYIMFDFLQSKYMEQSIGLASKIEKQFVNVCNRSSRGVKQAGFWVLKQAAMPAVLVELGYISNAEEERFLSKEESLDKFAKALHKAFLSYKKEHDNRSGVVYKETEKESLVKKENAKTVEQKDNTTTDSAEKAESKEEIYYAVQFCSSSEKKPLDCRDFRGFVPAKEYIETGKYKYKYVYGKEKTFKEGLALRDKVKEKFKDAFLVVIRNGEKLSTEEARKYYK